MKNFSVVPHYNDELIRPAYAMAAAKRLAQSLRNQGQYEKDKDKYIGMLKKAQELDGKAFESHRLLMLAADDYAATYQKETGNMGLDLPGIAATASRAVSQSAADEIEKWQLENLEPSIAMYSPKPVPVTEKSVAQQVREGIEEGFKAVSQAKSKEVELSFEDFVASQNETHGAILKAYKADFDKKKVENIEM